jgi:hypothetical protein
LFHGISGSESRPELNRLELDAMKHIATKSIACALVLLGIVALAPAAGAYGLLINATGDNFLTISINGGSYWGGPNTAAWQIADQFSMTVPDGQDLHLIFHVRNAFGLNDPLDPGGFLAELDLTGATWSSGGTQLLTNVGDWQYSLRDPLQGPTTWYTPASGWPSQWPVSAISPQTNGLSQWNELMDGPVAGIDESAQWLWSPQNYAEGAPGNTWWRFTPTINRPEKPKDPNDPVTPTVPEPGSVGLMALGVLALVARSRRK